MSGISEMSGIRGISGISLRIPDSVKTDPSEMAAFQRFLQRIANRMVVGGIRYGRISASKKYLSLLTDELKSYRKSGNSEQLLNIAVYAFLESYAPEHTKAHFDPTVESVTRR